MYTGASFVMGTALVCSVAAAAAAAAVPRCSLAVTHVNVIPMDSDRVLTDRTLRAGEGKILSITPADARPVSCQRVIDGAGRYLVPGLNDMHMHLETVAFAEAFGLKPEPIDYPSVLALYIANGVTGLRIMSGAPDILAFRDSQRATVSPYPRLIVASPMLSGAPPVLPEPVTKILSTPEEAREAVHRYSIQGYDFIKVRDNLPAPVLRAAIEEAARDGLYVDGHISQRQGLSVFEVLGSGQHAFAHLDDLALQMTDKVHDPERYIALLKKCGCFIETTIGVERNTLAQLDDYGAMIARPEMKFTNPLIVNAFWLKPNNPYLNEGPPHEFLMGLFADSKMLLKKFTDAGIHVVAGTDALNPMILPGVSLHDEFDNMIEAGLSPYQALKTATANAAAYVPGFGDVGVLAKGRAANAVLVKTNPLLDIRALRDPDAVMIGGHWRDRGQIQSMLHAVASAADFRDRDAQFRLAYAAQGPGAYAIVARGDKVDFSQGYGEANAELHVPFASDSVLRIASLTKQFTAVAVLQLVESGRLSLDERLEQVWRQCPAGWRAISLRQLLSHTSGITDDLAPVYERMQMDLSVDQLLGIYAERALLSPPGAAWRYSNVNYWILGKVIEISGGQTYADFVTSHTLVPGMRRTRYGSHDAIIENRAAGYEQGPDGVWTNARYFSATLGYAAGGFLSTPRDMATWYAALSRGELISLDTIAVALTPAKTNDGGSTGYGLGWYVTEAAGERIAHHGGSTFGFESYSYWVPSRALFAGVFKNRSDSDGEPAKAARALLRAAGVPWRED